MNQPDHLETERLVLRPFALSDFAVVHRYGTDPDVVLYQGWGPNTEESTRSFLTSAIENASGGPDRRWEFAITWRHNGELVGGAGIGPLKGGAAEIGYCLAREAWGLGIATEAARRLVDLGFDGLGAHRIHARCHPENIRSIRVLEKCGMTREGCLRHSLLVRGEWQDELLYSLLIHERP